MSRFDSALVRDCIMALPVALCPVICTPSFGAPPISPISNRLATAMEHALTTSCVPNSCARAPGREAVHLYQHFSRLQ